MSQSLKLVALSLIIRKLLRCRCCREIFSLIFVTTDKLTKYKYYFERKISRVLLHYKVRDMFTETLLRQKERERERKREKALNPRLLDPKVCVLYHYATNTATKYKTIFFCHEECSDVSVVELDLSLLA